MPRFFLGCLLFSTLAAAAQPTLTSLDVTSGLEHTLVSIQGADLHGAEIVWDAGLPGERILPGGFRAATMFSVPPGATVGAHPVAVQNAAGRSVPATFTVTLPPPARNPRVDHVTITGTPAFTANGVTALLYVQGPNIDVGATVEIDGVAVATTAHKALRNDLLGVSAASLAYPIDHYLAMIAVAPERPLDSTTSIVVTNLDGRRSTPFFYRMPASAATLDRDGDALLDAWETAGFDADDDGDVDVDVPALGVDPQRRDVLVEVDIMNGLSNPPIATTTTRLGTFDTARAMFDAAPVINPGARNGINLVVDASGRIPFASTIGFDVVDSALLSVARFSTLKAAHFDDATRGKIFHYAIWGNSQPGGYSGISDIVFDAQGRVTGPGDDFIVSFDSFPASYQTLRSQVETFVHELGHNLGQQHGGTNNARFKPNYWSVMAYTWQLRTGIDNSFRMQRVTCLPMYYGVSGADEPNGALPANINSIIDYSEGMAAPLVENAHALNEKTGVCGAAVDWNRDGDTNDTGLNADVDLNGVTAGVVDDFPNWRALRFDGPATNGSVQP